MHAHRIIIIIIYYYNQDGWTAFLTAAYKGRTDVLLLLLERGANMEAASNVSKGLGYLVAAHCIILTHRVCSERVHDIT